MSLPEPTTQLVPPPDHARIGTLRIYQWRHVCAATAVAMVITAASPAASQFLLPTRTDTPPQLMAPKPLTRSDLPPVERGERAGTGFFVDDAGALLTARHVVEGCGRIVVQKEGRSMSARLIAVSAPYDLALIRAAKTRGIAATFPRTVQVAANDLVFAADYTTLPAMRSHGGVLANASIGKTTGEEAGHIAINSTVTFGASGAPVLDSRGLVEGVISRKTNINRVLAVGAAGAKTFLAASHIRMQEDDRPQLSGSASRANRAASISARVICMN